MKVFSNLAISLDGKIADCSVPEKMLGTPYDRKKMLEIRLKADAVIFGAETLRVTGKCVKIPRSKRKKQIVNVVLSASGSLSPHLKFWDDPSVIRFVFTTEKGFAKLLKASRDRAFIIVAGKTTVDPKRVLQRLQGSGLKNLLVEGGGAVMRTFLEAKCLDELYVTLTPWLISGAQNPTLVGGQDTLVPWRKLFLLSAKKVKDELYLHYKTKK